MIFSRRKLFDLEIIVRLPSIQKTFRIADGSK